MEVTLDIMFLVLEAINLLSLRRVKFHAKNHTIIPNFHSVTSSVRKLHLPTKIAARKKLVPYYRLSSYSGAYPRKKY